MNRFQKLVLQPAEDARNGKIFTMPINLERVDENLMLRKRVYTLIGSNPGSGKSAFIDSCYLLSPYEQWRKAKMRGETDISFKSIYVAAERPEAEKLAKWACWKLYQDYGFQVPVEMFMGFRKDRATDEAWQRFVEAQDWIEELLDHVDLKNHSMSPTEYGALIDYHAKKDGLSVEADTIGIKEQGAANYMAFFTNAEKRFKKSGELVEYISYRGPDGEVYEMTPGDRLYFPHRPKEIVQLVYDHVGKTRGPGSDKERVDKISQISADARDNYHFSPVLVSQFNRAVGNIDRIKIYKDDLTPNLDDFKNTGATVEDCDVALALFNPLRYSAYDNKGFYKKYNIRNRMVTQGGKNRFRLLTILKNSYGDDNISYGLKFLGEVMHFSTLPKPEDTAALESVYREIAMGL